MVTAQTPNGDFATYVAHVESALDEWIRQGIVDVRKLISSALTHPTEEELAQASKTSQDGSVAYHLDANTGVVSVSPAIPHTEETVAAAKENDPNADVAVPEPPAAAEPAEDTRAPEDFGVHNDPEAPAAGNGTIGGTQATIPPPSGD